MLSRLVAALLIAAVAPSPGPSPLKTIERVRVQRLCVGLKRSVYPAVGRVLQNDKLIGQSRPLFRDYVKESASRNQGAVDLDVMRLERAIDPLVKNTQAIEALLNDPIYSVRVRSASDQDLLDMRAGLQEVLAQQKQALDLISGFTNTQQLGELQQEGNDYPSVSAPGRQSSPPPQPGPSVAPNELLNAGIPNPQRSSDPRYQTTDSLEGYNPLNAFDQQMDSYQQGIATSEDATSKAIFKAVSECGGKAP